MIWCVETRSTHEVVLTDKATWVNFYFTKECINVFMAHLLHWCLSKIHFYFNETVSVSLFAENMFLVFVFFLFLLLLFFSFFSVLNKLFGFLYDFGGASDFLPTQTQILFLSGSLGTILWLNIRLFVLLWQEGETGSQQLDKQYFTAWCDGPSHKTTSIDYFW